MGMSRYEDLMLVESFVEHAFPLQISGGLPKAELWGRFS